MKDKKRVFISVIFYLAIILAGVNAYFLTKNGIDPNKSLFLQGLSFICLLLVAFGTFYELYFGNSKINKDK